MIRDYVHGNLRVERAESFVRRFIHAGTREVLDVGCGIGASSMEYLSANPALRVHGIDISPRNIEIAGRLFVDERLRFSAGTIDVLPAGPAGTTYDLVVLMDVYEHIGKDDRPRFNASLASHLADNGSVVLTFPSPSHQEHLRRFAPDGLQIIDETVSLENVAALAETLNATVVHYEWVHVWRKHDYVHAAMSRSPRYDALDLRTTDRRRGLPRLWRHLSGLASRDARSTRWRRRLEVRRKLGITL